MLNRKLITAQDGVVLASAIDNVLEQYQEICDKIANCSFTDFLVIFRKQPLIQARLVHKLADILQSAGEIIQKLPLHVKIVSGIKDNNLINIEEFISTAKDIQYKLENRLFYKIKDDAVAIQSFFIKVKGVVILLKTVRGFLS